MFQARSRSQFAITGQDHSMAYRSLCGPLGLDLILYQQTRDQSFKVGQSHCLPSEVKVTHYPTSQSYNQSVLVKDWAWYFTRGPRMIPPRLVHQRPRSLSVSHKSRPITTPQVKIISMVIDADWISYFTARNQPFVSKKGQYKPIAFSDHKLLCGKIYWSIQ